MVLEDTILANLDVDRLNRVLAPKVKGADNLDKLTRGLNLDYFVLFSTLVTLIGNAGQGNYVAANAFMEGLARRRRQDGLPALAIGWGPIADVGVLVRKQLLESSIQKLSGVRGMTAREGLELMAQALALDGADPNLAVVTIALHTGGFGGGNLAVLRSPTYSAMTRAGFGQSDATITSIDVQALLKKETMDVVRRIVADGIVTQLAGVLHAREENISRMHPLGEIGIDSLMALEFGMNIESVFGVQISLAGSVGNLTVSQLAVEVIAQVSQNSPPAADAATAIVERHVGKIDTAHVNVVKQALRDDSQRFNGLAS
jgi:acyl carrier protein